MGKHAFYYSSVDSLTQVTVVWATTYQWVKSNLFRLANIGSTKEYNRALEPITKKRLGLLARPEAGKKRSKHVVCEHFELLRNAARGTYIFFEIGSSLCFDLTPFRPYWWGMWTGSLNIVFYHVPNIGLRRQQRTTGNEKPTTARFLTNQLESVFEIGFQPF